MSVHVIVTTDDKYGPTLAWHLNRWSHCHWSSSFATGVNTTEVNTTGIAATGVQSSCGRTGARRQENNGNGVRVAKAGNRDWPLFE